tara:strand:- start:838 stop:1842 length:1005 start_codon:yes stop_codon:yes gene_type:complete
MFKNKKLLITGGTGSFGVTVLKRFLKTDVKEIIIYSRDEKKQEEVRNLFSNDKIKFYIGDVRNYTSIYEALDGVDYVFSAAALKQVPSCEFYPMEALQTNVIGVENVLRASKEQSVKKAIVLSTDKAVYPINVMGLTKAMSEKVMIAKSRHYKSITMSATRYGNVMASRGSVIPLFVDQILNNQPITITNPNMTRFMMSLEDSVDLVLYAFAKSQSGDIFVQKAPATTIENLAIVLKDIFNSRSEIKIIGTRHGEKLYESLLSGEEMTKAQESKKYYRIPMDSRGLNYKQYFVKGKEMKNNLEDYNSSNTDQLDFNGLKNILLKLDYIKKILNV